MNKFSFIIAAATPRQWRGHRPDPAFLAAQQTARRGGNTRAQASADAEALATVRAEAVANAAVIADANAATAARDKTPLWTATAQWTPPPDMPRW